MINATRNHRLIAIVYAAINSSPYFVANALQKYRVTFNEVVLITKLPNICINDFILGLNGNLTANVILVFLYNNTTDRIKQVSLTVIQPNLNHK